jgi:membrane protein
MKFLKTITGFVENIIRKAYRIFVLPLILLSRKIVLPGFRGVPLYDVGLFFIRGIRKSSISLRANAITYSFIIAFVPAILFLFTLIPYIPISGLHDNVMESLREILPSAAYLTIFKTIEDIITNQQGGLLSLSFLISIYFASNGIIAIMNAFNQSSHSIETRTNFRKRLVSLILVFILALNIIISAGALAISSYLLYYIEGKGMISDNFTVILLKVGQWITILLTSLIAFSSIFYLAPARRGSFPFFSAGSILAAILSVITFKIFIIFIENFSNVNKFYGSLGTLIVLIMWINLTALMLLIGFELNASIYEAKKNGKANPKKMIHKAD